MLSGFELYPRWVPLKRRFSLFLNTPRTSYSPIQCWDITEQLLAQTPTFFFNIGKGGRVRRKGNKK